MTFAINQERVRPIKEFLTSCRAGGRLKLNANDQTKFCELFKQQTQIVIDFEQKSPFTFLETVLAATWFLAEKYEFRADILGLSPGTVRSHENRIKIKLGFSRSAHAYCWFLSKKIIAIDYSQAIVF